MNKIRLLKQNHYKKKIAKRNDKIDLLKEMDNALAEVTFDDYSLQNKSKNAYVQKRLNKIQPKLAQLRKNYDLVKNDTSIEKNIERYDELIQIVSLVSYDNLSLKDKSKDDFIQQRLDAIAKRLSPIKEKCEAATKTNSAKAESLHQEFDKALTKEKQRIDAFKSQAQKELKKHEEKIEHLHKSFQTELEKEIYKVKVSIARLRHKNKVTGDRLWWQELSKEERKERRSDLSFYIPDVQGYWLTLLSVVAEIIYLILLLGIMVRTYWVGATILVNIAFLLFLFTIAIKVKNYKKAFSYCSIVFGVYCLVRILWVIQGLMEVDLSSASTKTQGWIYGCNIYMIAASIYVGIRSLIKIKRQEVYIKEEKISKIQMSK